ncbi:MAG: flagellar transcriptional regulator FlhD [Methylococcaceae bacterium]
MNTDKLMKEIRDINLNYLILAQYMIHEDMDMAIYRLGISQEIATIINNLSSAQLIKLASSTSMISSFRFDDVMILEMLTHDKKSLPMSHAHSAILLANQPVRNIC